MGGSGVALVGEARHGERTQENVRPGVAKGGEARKQTCGVGGATPVQLGWGGVRWDSGW